MKLKLVNTKKRLGLFAEISPATKRRIKRNLIKFMKAHPVKNHGKRK